MIRFIGVYDYTVILTYMSLISSVFGMTQAIHGITKLQFFVLLFREPAMPLTGELPAQRKTGQRMRKTLAFS